MGCEKSLTEEGELVLDYCLAMYRTGSTPNNACITNTPGFTVTRGATTTFTIDVINKAGPPRTATIHAQATVGGSFTCSVSPSTVNIPGSATLSVTVANIQGPSFSDNCPISVTSEGQVRTYIVFLGST